MTSNRIKLQSNKDECSGIRIHSWSDNGEILHSILAGYCGYCFFLLCLFHSIALLSPFFPLPLSYICTFLPSCSSSFIQTFLFLRVFPSPCRVFSCHTQSVLLATRTISNVTVCFWPYSHIFTFSLLWVLCTSLLKKKSPFPYRSVSFDHIFFSPPQFSQVVAPQFFLSSQFSGLACLS